MLSLGLAAATLIVHAPVRQHEFVDFDDLQYVSENPAVRGGLSRQALVWAFTTGHAGNWHPVTWLSHMLDVQLFGLEAGAHHLTSLALHVANALLLFGLLRGLTGAVYRSAFVAALFALHPLHVESVAWVAERKDVLCAFLFLLTLWAYVAYVRQPRAWRYAVVLVLFALGLMAKPMLVTLPFVLLLLDFWPLRRASGAWRRRVVEKLPLVVLAAASSLVTFVVQARAGAVKDLEEFPLGGRLANAGLAYFGYMGKMLWPRGLAAIYPYPSSRSVLLALGALLALIAISVVMIRVARRHPYLPVGWFWYAGMLVPVVGLIQVGSQPMADRYTYLPLVGLFMVAAWAVPDLAARLGYHRLGLALLAGIALLGCAITARRQVRHWRNSVVLWERALAVTDGNHRARHNLGHALARAGRSRDAIPHYREALRLKPHYPEAHNNLGVALADHGQLDEAIEHYSEALRLLPDYVEAHNNLGVALTDRGAYGDAIRHFSEAVRLDPSLAVSHNNLGAALARQGKPEPAMASFAEALRRSPGYTAARNNLAVAHERAGAALADRGRVDEAIVHYAEAVRLRPDLADAHANMARALAGQGRVEEAIRALEQALRADPRDPDLHHDVAVLFLRKGDTAGAVRRFETALALDPAHQASRKAVDALARPRSADR